ncbi:MAG: hypothetical protein HYV63_33560 [Candidatus Schekmanbacteria bacterium]|nr:hypothetical protein [Candidatus Schekmanbacteria bacterium]
MVIGFNTDVAFQGTTYHVQTEVKARAANPRVETRLYVGGAILAAKQTSYREIADIKQLERVLTKVAAEQHKSVIGDIHAGKYAGNRVDRIAADLISSEPLAKILARHLGFQDEPGAAESS